MCKCAGKSLKLLLPDILRLKCIKFDIGWGYASDPAGELMGLLQTL